jgi:hypothetical protein
MTLMRNHHLFRSISGILGIVEHHGFVPICETVFLVVVSPCGLESTCALDTDGICTAEWIAFPWAWVDVAKWIGRMKCPSTDFM